MREERKRSASTAAVQAIAATFAYQSIAVVFLIRNFVVEDLDVLT